MGISVVWVKMLWRRYRVDGRIPELKKPGRRPIEASEEEKELIRKAYQDYEAGAVLLEHIIDFEYGKHVPHNRIHGVKSLGLAKDEPRKHGRKKWIRYERKYYFNSLWHTDWKLLEGYGWLVDSLSR